MTTALTATQTTIPGSHREEVLASGRAESDATANATLKMLKHSRMHSKPAQPDSTQQ